MRIWLEAARPRTLPAAVAPVLVGAALAWHDGVFSAPAAALCLAFALLVQIGTNFANDYYDFKRGADTATRVGPRRAVAAGLVSRGRRGEHCLRNRLHGRAVAPGVSRAG
jgi:1,4-dihydroxy-2-naphthoate octaprenyltransferase